MRSPVRNAYIRFDLQTRSTQDIQTVREDGLVRVTRIGPKRLSRSLGRLSKRWVAVSGKLYLTRGV